MWLLSTIFSVEGLPQTRGDGTRENIQDIRMFRNYAPKIFLMTFTMISTSNVASLTTSFCIKLAAELEETVFTAKLPSEGRLQRPPSCARPATIWKLVQRPPVGQKYCQRSSAGRRCASQRKHELELRAIRHFRVVKETPSRSASRSKHRRVLGRPPSCAPATPSGTEQLSWPLYYAGA